MKAILACLWVGSVLLVIAYFGAQKPRPCDRFAEHYAVMHDIQIEAMQREIARWSNAYQDQRAFSDRLIRQLIQTFPK